MTTCPSGVHYQHLIDHARVHVERDVSPAVGGALAALRARGGAAVSAGACAPRSGSRRLARPFARLLPAPLRALLALAPRRARAVATATRGGAAEARAAPRARRAAHRLRANGHRPARSTPRRFACSSAAAPKSSPSAAAAARSCTTSASEQPRERARRHARRAAAPRARRPGLDAIVVERLGLRHARQGLRLPVPRRRALAGPAAAVSAKARDVTEVLAELGLPPVTRAATRPPSRITRRARCSTARRSTGSRARCSQPPGYERARDRRRPSVLRFGRHLQRAAARDRRASARSQARPHRADRRPLVATGNVGCMTQLAAGGAFRVVHTVELLDWATGGPLDTSP